MTLGSGLKKTGRIVQDIGCICLIVASVIGALAIDLVILIGVLTGKIDKPTFVLYMIFSLFLNRSDTSRPMSLGSFLLGALISTVIAIIIAAVLGMPIVAIGLAAAWIIAAVILGIGFGLEKLGETLEPSVGAAVGTVVGSTSEPTPEPTPGYGQPDAGYGRPANDPVTYTVPIGGARLGSGDQPVTQTRPYERAEERYSYP